jgi:hypothetical protein
MVVEALTPRGPVWFETGVCAAAPSLRAPVISHAKARLAF